MNFQKEPSLHKKIACRETDKRAMKKNMKGISIFYRLMLVIEKWNIGFLSFFFLENNIK